MESFIQIFERTLSRWRIIQLQSSASMQFIFVTPRRPPLEPNQFDPGSENTGDCHRTLLANIVTMAGYHDQKLHFCSRPENSSFKNLHDSCHVQVATGYWLLGITQASEVEWRMVCKVREHSEYSVQIHVECKVATYLWGYSNHSRSTSVPIHKGLNRDIFRYMRRSFWIRIPVTLSMTIWPYTLWPPTIRQD